MNIPLIKRALKINKRKMKIPRTKDLNRQFKKEGKLISINIFKMFDFTRNYRNAV